METKTCIECLCEKDIDEFVFRDMAKGRRYRECRDCRAAKHKAKVEASGKTVRYSVIEVKRLREQGLARCPECDEIKTLVDGFGINAASSTGFASHCKACARVLGVALYRKPDQKRKSQEHYTTNKEMIRDKYLQRRFGITLAQYNEMLKEQGGVCAICGSKDKNRSLAVDHDHKTGKVRGLLCGRCNPAVGFCMDSPQLAAKLLHYIETHNGGGDGVQVDSQPISQ